MKTQLNLFAMEIKGRINSDLVGGHIELLNGSQGRTFAVFISSLPDIMISSKHRDVWERRRRGERGGRKRNRGKRKRREGGRINTRLR